MLGDLHLDRKKIWKQLSSLQSNLYRQQADEEQEVTNWKVVQGVLSEYLFYRCVYFVATFG